MSENKPESKSTIAKLFTLVGFVVTIVLVVYVAVKAVNLAPEFLIYLSNLNSPATQTEDSLIITTDKNSVGLDEPVAINWSAPMVGIYTFTAECDEGVVLSRETVDGTAPLPCGQIVHLESETSVTLTGIKSKTEIAEVYYLVGLIDKDSGDLVLEGDGYFTINNPDADRTEENSPAPDDDSEEQLSLIHI